MATDLIKVSTSDDEIPTVYKIILMYILIIFVIMINYSNLFLKYILTPMNMVNIMDNTPTMQGKIILAIIQATLIILLYFIIFKFI